MYRTPVIRARKRERERERFFVSQILSSGSLKKFFAQCVCGGKGTETHRANLIAHFHELLVIAPLTNHFPERLFHLALEPFVRVLRLAGVTGVFFPVFQRR